MNDELLVKRNGGVIEITFNRPHKKNAFSEEMYIRFTDVLQQAQADKTVRCLVLKGADNTFTSGNDLNTFVADSTKASQPPAVFAFLEALIANDVPMVAVVTGIATGLGSALLLHCDTAIATGNARFAFSFANIGATPEVCASMLLPQLCGYQKAANLIMTGRMLDSREALQIGLVTEVVSVEQLDDRVKQTVQAIVEKSTEALRITKRLLKRAPESYVQRLAIEEQLFAERLKSAEMQKAISDFLIK